MSIIIRLQNLPWAANALDIRQYFQGLSIPEGGVHIVGGELGDAFIAFSTDEDARQAFNRNDGQIKGVQIRLMLSSRQEMQRVIEQARNQSMAAFMLPTTPQIPTPLPAAVPQVIPAAVPEIKRDNKEKDSDRNERKKDKKRSRSRSKSRDRDKKERSRDRKDRKHRDRSRSRSRERRDRRRRERSRSRNRSRSRDRESRRRDKDRSPKRERDQDNGLQIHQRDVRKPMPEIWASQTTVTAAPLNIIAPNESPGLLGPFPLTVDAPKHPLVDKLNVNLQPQGINGFQPNNPTYGMVNQQNIPLRGRENWASGNGPQNQNMGNNFPQASEKIQGPMTGGRGARNDARRDFFGRDNQNQGEPSHFDGKKPGISRKSRFSNNEEYNESPINACVSMEPFYGSYGDLRRFFNGLSINYRGIKVINDEFGHKTGICFVQFRDSYAKTEALKMNGQKLNNIDVKIEHITDQVFNEAIDRYHPRMDDYNNQNDESTKFGRHKNISKYFNNATPQEPEIKEFLCLKIEDLPTYVKEQDILHIFSQHPLISLHLNSKPRGGSVAYVKFGSKEVAKLALEEKSHHVIGGKPVTVKPCRDEEFEQVNKEQCVVLEDSPPKNFGTDCLNVCKLPLKINDRDISDFFSDIGVIPTKIHLMSNVLGFTGQAYCEFESDDEASKALSKNNTMLGQNTISVVPIKRKEMESLLGSIVSYPDSHTKPTLSSPHEHESGSVETSQKAIQQFFNSPEQSQIQSPPNFIQMHEGNVSQPLGLPTIRPMMGHRPPHLRGADNHMGFGGPRGLGPRGPRFAGRGRGGHRFNHHSTIKNETYEETPPGCTVYMDNVPYKAGTDEILDFFDGYNCTNNVSRRYNPNNTPSAEARVTFHNPDDAFRAVRELQGQKIWDRSIYLRQA